MAKATRAAQISDTVEFRHHHLTQPTVTPIDRIFHGVNKLTCALHDAPHIVFDNQLLAIDALHQAIQIWTKTTGPPQTKPHRTTLSHTRTRPRSILRPLRRPQEEIPPDSTPRVAIPKPPDILIPQLSITSQDEPIAWRTRSRFTTMDRQPPTGEQNNLHSANFPAHAFTNRGHGQCHHPSPSVPTTISIQFSSKSSNARTQQNFREIVTVPPTA